MNLGSSLRRGRQRRRRAKSPGQGGAVRWAVWRALAIGVALLVGGYAAGFVFSTEVLFPEAERARDFVSVPDLIGMTAQNANSALGENGLGVASVDSLRHPTVGEGLIFGQSPLPGQLSLPGGEVRLTLSLGPELSPIPDVVRLRGDRARTVLEATGFTVVVDSVDDAAPKGQVVAVLPLPGAVVSLPHEVILTLSKGPPLVEMPLLLGLAEDEALAELEALELVVSDVEAVFRFGLDQGVVVEQEPSAGELVERGAAVRIAVGRRGLDGS